METGTKAGRVRSLVVELGARTAILNGTRVELPPTEFSLLAVLAARPGEVVEHKALLTEAFGNDSYMTPTDLHWRIWNVRQLLGDSDRRLIRNRRGVGFLLALPTDAVEVVKGVATAPQPEPVIRLDEPETAADDSPSEVSFTAPSQAGDMGSLAPAEPVRKRITFRPRALLIAGLVAILALGTSWIAGYGLSQLRSSFSSESAAPPAQEAPEPPGGSGEQRASDKSSAKNDRDPKKGRDRGHRGEGVAVAVSGAPVSSSSGDVSDPSGTTERQSASSKTKEKPEPPPPPQPDALLYHLFNPDSGDHFVTTSSNIANQKQADGYNSATEGKAFSTQQKGTVAIALDSGTAYIYRSRDSAPKGVSVVELYRLSKGGDLFYTRSSSAANQAEAQGWDRSVAGFVQ